MVTFREATSSTDRETLIELNRAIFPVTYDQDFYDTMRIRSHYHAMLLFYGDRAIGTLAFELEKDAAHASTAYVFTFGILSEFRDRGIGSTAWREAERIIRETYQCSAILLHTQVASARAIGFYRKHGFTIKERIENYYEGLPCNSAYLMRKSCVSEAHFN